MLIDFLFLDYYFVLFIWGFAAGWVWWELGFAGVFECGFVVGLWCGLLVF